jgi:hypothetical protein
MFFEGFLVSPAVIPRLSVPPSGNMGVTNIKSCGFWKRHTGKTGGDENSGEAPEASDKWSSRYAPISRSDKLVLFVEAKIDENTENDKYQHGRDFEGR